MSEQLYQLCWRRYFDDGKIIIGRNDGQSFLSRAQWFDDTPQICTACGEVCDIDDGSVEPELMARAIRSPFLPSSACCGADYETEDES